MSSKKQKTSFLEVFIKNRELGLIAILILLIAIVTLRTPAFFTGE